MREVKLTPYSPDVHEQDGVEQEGEVSSVSVRVWGEAEADLESLWLGMCLAFL